MTGGLVRPAQEWVRRTTADHPKPYSQPQPNYGCCYADLSSAASWPSRATSLPLLSADALSMSFSIT